jgi:hypothetical protein
MPNIRAIESYASPGLFIYVERSKEAGKLFTALAQAHAKFETPKKNRTGQYGDYADLVALQQATKSALAASHLFVCQTFHTLGEDLILNTTLGHASGEYISSQVPIKQSVNPQHTTAYATYMRRLAYSAILSLAADDDQDGEAASTAATTVESESKEAVLKRALKAIQTAEDLAALDQKIARVRSAVADGSLPSNSEARLASAANQRRMELRGQGGEGAAGAVAK